MLQDPVLLSTEESPRQQPVTGISEWVCNCGRSWAMIEEWKNLMLLFNFCRSWKGPCNPDQLLWMACFGCSGFGGGGCFFLFMLEKEMPRKTPTITLLFLKWLFYKPSNSCIVGLQEERTSKPQICEHSYKISTFVWRLLFWTVRNESSGSTDSTALNVKNTQNPLWQQPNFNCL